MRTVSRETSFAIASLGLKTLPFISFCVCGHVLNKGGAVSLSLPAVFFETAALDSVPAGRRFWCRPMLNCVEMFV